LKPIDYEELHEVLGKAVQRADANMLVKEHVHQRARKYFNDESGPTHSSSDVVEKIKEYVKGDDYRTINWKASARRHELSESAVHGPSFQKKGGDIHSGIYYKCKSKNGF
jgi:hypothetical protein